MSSAAIRSASPRPLGREPQRGNPIEARDFTRVWGALRDLSVLNGAAGDLTPEEIIESSLRFLVVTSADTPGSGVLFGHDVDDQQSTKQDYSILLPPTFYELSRGGVTYTYTTYQQRTATDGETNETQYLVPSLVVNDVLLCLRSRGVWLDLNIDGRQWAADPP